MMKTIILLSLVAYAYSVTCPTQDGDEPIYLPNPEYCGKFFECSTGRAWSFDCAPGTYFDIEKNECAFDVDCGDRLLSTTTTTEGTTTEESTEATTTEESTEASTTAEE